MVEIGETAADFTLRGTQGDEISEFTLSAFGADRPTLVAFYVHDFSPVCEEQMCEINDVEMLTFNDDAAVLGISPDGPYSHRQFIGENDLSYPLLSDPGLSVYEQYGFVEETEFGAEPKRGIVLLDEDRSVQYRWEPTDSRYDWEVEVLSEVNELVNEFVEN